MTGQAIIFGDVKQISFSELRIEHSIAGESSYRILTIESGNGGKFRIKLCGNECNLKAILDEELDAFLDDADALSQAEAGYFDGKALEMIVTTTGGQFIRNSDRVMDWLGLVGITSVTAETISNWTNEECEEVEVWAMSLHLAASDNEGVLIPQTPECLAEYVITGNKED